MRNEFFFFSCVHLCVCYFYSRQLTCVEGTNYGIIDSRNIALVTYLSFYVDLYDRIATASGTSRPARLRLDSRDGADDPPNRWYRHITASGSLSRRSSRRCCWPGDVAFDGRQSGQMLLLELFLHNGVTRWF